MIIELKSFFHDVGCFVVFASRFFVELIRPPFETREFIRQCYVIGFKSLPLVAITGFIMGLVLTLQSRPTLADFGAESWIGTPSP